MSVHDKEILETLKCISKALNGNIDVKASEDCPCPPDPATQPGASCDNPLFVKDCSDIEKEFRCDKNTGHIIAVEISYGPSGRTITYWDIFSNTAYAGDPETDLELCPGKTIEADPIDYCDANGVGFIRWFLLDNGVPIDGVFYDRDELNNPFVPVLPIKRGPCDPCSPSISQAFGDNLSSLQASHNFSFIKPACASVLIQTSIGTFSIPKGVQSFSTSDFACTFTVDSITIASGNAILSEIQIIGNKLK